MGFEEEYEKTECCPRNYTRLYTSERKATCGMCSRDLSNPECRPYEASEIPAWSARGPAKSRCARDSSCPMFPEVRHMLQNHFSVFLLTVFVTAGATS